jgi:TolB-like protein
MVWKNDKRDSLTMKSKEKDRSRPSIFLSHSHSDKDFARKLAKDLIKADAKVWIDEAEIKLGESLITKIREGIDTVDYLAVILSPDSVKSEWVINEVNIAMNKQICGQNIKVLPLMYRKCELPGFLEGRSYADFTIEKNYDDAFAFLLKSIGIVSSIPSKAPYNNERIPSKWKAVLNLKKKLKRFIFLLLVISILFVCMFYFLKKESTHPNIKTIIAEPSIKEPINENRLDAARTNMNKSFNLPPKDSPIIEHSKGSTSTTQESIAVLPFLNNTGNQNMDWLGWGIAESISTTLSNTNKNYKVIERAQIDKIIEEQKFQQTSFVDRKTAVQIGKLAGVDYVLIGSYQIYRDQLKINVKKVSVATAEITGGINVMGKSADNFNLQEEVAEKARSLFK